MIIDGGNAHFPDTARRAKYVEGKGLLYVGSGVSGGEEGALRGPEHDAGWFWAGLAAGEGRSFSPFARKGGRRAACCDWVGEGGSGHFVKMVHNGIEYGDMQLICEAYQLMKDCVGMGNEEMREVFSAWNRTELDSYLIEITADILGHREADGSYTVDHILDTAGQKGTG